MYQSKMYYSNGTSWVGPVEPGAGGGGGLTVTTGMGFVNIATTRGGHSAKIYDPVFVKDCTVFVQVINEIVDTEELCPVKVYWRCLIDGELSLTFSSPEPVIVGNYVVYYFVIK